MSSELFPTTMAKFNGENEYCVDAMELYKFIKPQAAYAEWISNYIKTYKFYANMDYVFSEMSGFKYLLSFSAAQGICLIENTMTSQAARHYLWEIARERAAIRININQEPVKDRKNILNFLKSEERWLLSNTLLKLADSGFYGFFEATRFRAEAISLLLRRPKEEYLPPARGSGPGPGPGPQEAGSLRSAHNWGDE
jgi:phage anti-repressor protein